MARLSMSQAGVTINGDQSELRLTPEDEAYLARLDQAFGHKSESALEKAYSTALRSYDFLAEENAKLRGGMRAKDRAVKRVSVIAWVLWILALAGWAERVLGWLAALFS